MRSFARQSLDDEAGFFEVTVGNGKPAPEIGALIPKNIIDSPDHRARLLDLAEYTAKFGIDKEARPRGPRQAIVVGSPALLRPACKPPKQMRQASGVCAVVEGGMPSAAQTTGPS